MIVEYRLQYNPFYALSDALLPGIFQVGIVDPNAIDEIGRRAVQGPAQVPLEAVAMLAMALPIALVRLLQSDRTRERLLYGLAAGVLLAAMVATFRKTAFLAPISVCLTLAYLRRGELVKLAPLGVVVVLMVQVLAPGALSSVAGQLDHKRLGVTTVSDRTADYDAIRPDVWSHLVFGRGYGSYDHATYRVLDMELLRQLIEVGVVGLLAYLMLVVAVVAVARGPIRARRPDDTPVALAVASAAVCFLVVSTLFDVMSFPHVPYVFLWMAALLAVMRGPTSQAPVQRAASYEPAAERLAGVVEPETAMPREPAWSS
jgi:O-antigen ligase